MKRKYDIVKLKCRDLFKSLKKFHFWLYERYFIVETDAQMLIWLLNQSSNDLSNAIMTRWLFYIQLFNFDIKHIKNKKNDIIDDLSQWELMKDDNDKKDDLDIFFNIKMNMISVELIKYYFIWIWLNWVEYLEKDLMLEEYLKILKRFNEIDNQ